MIKGLPTVPPGMTFESPAPACVTDVPPPSVLLPQPLAAMTSGNDTEGESISLKAPTDKVVDSDVSDKLILTLG